MPTACCTFQRRAACLVVIVAIGAMLPSLRGAAEVPVTAANLDAKFDELAAADRNVPRDSFDPAAVIESVGRDRAALVNWVRDNTMSLPYDGALKGPVGVLLDRAGNSLDRSLLLARLLNMAGYEVRLARAALSEQQSQEFTKELSATQKARDRPAGPEKATAERERVASHLAALKAALGQTPANAPGVTGPREYWWVQVHEGQAWTDVDLTVPGAGSPARAQPAETFPVGKDDGTIPLPPKFLHQLEVAIVIEAWDDQQKKLVERPVLHAVLRPAELLGRRVLLRHHVIKSRNPTKLPPGHEPTAAEAKAAALAASEWLPVLEVAGRRISKGSFSDTGKVQEKADLSGINKMSGANARTFGGLGGALGGGGAKTEDRSILTAEWIDYTIHSPGRPDRKVRREGFDLVGPAARASLAAAPQVDDAAKINRALLLAGITESLVLGCTPTQSFASHVMAEQMLAQRALCKRVLLSPDPAERQSLTRLIHPGSPLIEFAVARRAVSPAAAQIHLDSINVLNLRSFPQISPDGKLVVRNQTDIVDNEVAASGFDARLTQGIADTAAESLFLTGDLASTQNTFGLLAAPGAPAMKLVRDATDPLLAQLNCSPDARARIASDIAAGYAIVLPATRLQSGSLGWWRVQPQTGQVVGVMENGFHSDITEEAYLNGDTVIREAGGLDETFIGRAYEDPRWWRFNHRAIIEHFGGNPEDMDLVNVVLDLQNYLVSMGAW